MADASSALVDPPDSDPNTKGVVKKAAAGAAIGVLMAGLTVPVSASPAAATADSAQIPTVILGTELTPLAGVSGDRLAGFRWSADGWQQVTVQLDERKVVDPGLIRGGPVAGFTTTQYADAGTLTGADPDVGLDGNDELVFMTSDAGPQAPNQSNQPAGTTGLGARVAVTHPTSTGAQYLYLFRATSPVTPPRKDVTYSFQLNSGAYPGTYNMAKGPNPESSWASSDVYRLGFSDRWLTDQLRLGPTGPDILDGFKNRFGLETCGRSNKTFSEGGGAIIANVDGPVRGIRSVIGANSGTYTQRTTTMYADRIEVGIDLRVHAIPGVMDLVDYSAAANGYTYQNSLMPTAALLDGVDDAVPAGLPSWERLSGPAGSVLATREYEDSAGLSPRTSYTDRAPQGGELECWGDGTFRGMTGTDVSGGVPNTDPTRGAAGTLRSVATYSVLGPAMNGANAASLAQRHQPPATQVSVYRSGGDTASQPQPSPKPPVTEAPGKIKAKVAARAKNKRDKLRVRVKPKLGEGRQWKISVQKRKTKTNGDRVWRTQLKKQTRTKRHVRTLDLQPGRYRVKVLDRRSYFGTRSSSVRLRR